MRVALLLLAAALAGCVDSDAIEEVSCPGHHHHILYITDGTEPVPYFDAADTQNEGGIHMHGDDHLLHLHPAQETCFTAAQAWAPVDVVVGDVVTVNGVDMPGEYVVHRQDWGMPWQEHTAGLDVTVQDAQRWLIAIDPPADVSAVTDQVPPIPATYQPS